MKRFVIILCFAAGISLTARAQITVREEGRKAPTEKMVLRSNTRDQMIVMSDNMHRRVIYQRKQEMIKHNQMYRQRKMHMLQHRQMMNQQQRLERQRMRQHLVPQKRMSGR